MTEEASAKPAGRFIIPLLIAIFIAPFLASWLLFNFSDLGKRAGTANHGRLITPPKPLPDLSLSDPVSGSNNLSLHGKWSLLYLVKGNCSDQCEKNLYVMRQLRLAMGKEVHRVQRVLLVVNNDTAVLSADQLKDYKGQLVTIVNDREGEELLANFKLADEDQPIRADRLYLVDPLGNLMMTYPPAVEPGGIIKDLKRLLKYSRIG